MSWKTRFPKWFFLFKHKSFLVYRTMKQLLYVEKSFYNLRNSFFLIENSVKFFCYPNLIKMLKIYGKNKHTKLFIEKRKQEKCKRLPKRRRRFSRKVIVLWCLRWFKGYPFWPTGHWLLMLVKVCLAVGFRL